MGLFGGEISFNNLNVTGGLSVTGGTTTDTLTVNSTSTFKAKLSVTAGGISVVGGATVDTLSASSTLTVTGAATLKSTLSVTGTTSHAAKVTITAGGLAVTGGGITVTGGLATDTLDVSSSITITGAANLNGGINAAGDVSWTGKGTSGGTDFILGINDTSRGTPGTSGTYRALVKQATNVLVINYGGDFTGGVQIQSSATVTGNLTINGTGTSTFGGSVTINGNLNLTSGNISAINFLYGTAGTIAQSTDEWLRLNGDGTHSSGVYFGNSIVRTDGQFQVGGSGSAFLVTSSGNVTANSITATVESHFSSGTYSDPQSGYTRGLKVSQGIATDYLYVSGAVHCESYLNNTGTYQVNSCPFIQMAYVTIPNNGSGGYKWTFPTAIPSANGCQPIVTLNIVPGTQYFVNAGNNSRSSCTYYHSSSGSLSGWIFEVSQ